ncbi:MAG: protein BatD [Oceanospirillales bacterium]|nr:protein BatD [Oceanospirillales bacterium]MBR9886096.1 protein BatD [Oceanospirillales bacterium]
MSVNELITLHIDITTPTWFGAGPRIGKIIVPNLLAMKNHQTLFNYSSQKAGQTWSHQQIEIPMFASRSGEYFIPSTPVYVQVSLPSGNRVNTTLMTPAFHFSAMSPSPHITSQSVWIAAPDVRLQQAWQFSNEPLQTGDSLIRTVQLEAEDSLSVLLPNLTDRTLNDSFQTYISPSQFNDTNQRGTRTASRSEKTTYIVQQGGKTVIPDLRILWWDTDDHILKELTLAGRTLEVRHTPISWLRQHSMTITLSTLILLVFCYIIFRLRYGLHVHSGNKYLSLFTSAYRGDWPQCRTLLYRRLYEATGHTAFRHNPGSSRLQQDTALIMSDNPNKSAVFRLWLALRRKQKHKGYQYRVLTRLAPSKKQQK